MRELENAIQRALIVCTGESIESWHLGLSSNGWRTPTPGAAEQGMDYASNKQRVVEEFQRQFVHRALANERGNISRAAEACGLTRAALQRIMRTLEIDREDYC